VSTVRERILSDMPYDIYLGPYDFPLVKMRTHLRKDMSDILIALKASYYDKLFITIIKALENYSLAQYF
jgi:hypothetical protein